MFLKPCFATNITFGYRILGYLSHSDIPSNDVPLAPCRCHTWTLVSLLHTQPRRRNSSNEGNGEGQS